MHDRNGTDELTSLLASHARVCAEQRTLLALIAQVEKRDQWHDEGARDFAHWLSMRFGLSHWKARRWIEAARALERQPRLSEALASGELGMDKIVELCRFATPQTESALIRWAGQVSCAAIRRRGDLHAQSLLASQEAERESYLEWWFFDEGRRLGLQGELPADKGAALVRAIEREAANMPSMPGRDHESPIEVRRADALAALASARIASDPDPDRATVVVHAPLDALVTGEGGCEIEGGGTVHAETARRLACSARIQILLEDANGQPLKMGRLSREPSDAMMRALRHRDRECRFPGCGSRRYTNAHHIRWWRLGGRTDLDNLLLLCSFHHRLVHEHGWRVRRNVDGTAAWARPGGIPYRAEPVPKRTLHRRHRFVPVAHPGEPVSRQPVLVASRK